MPTPLAQALEEAARRQPPKPSTPLANALMEYASRVQGDFQHGLDQSAQGFGEMVNGQLATGIPRTFLGGLGWLGSPVSGALSPILSPIMTPVAQGVHEYVGKPIENATGYPADLTTELALAAALPKALHGAGRVVNHAVPYLSRLGDAVGERIGAPADAYLSGPVPKPPSVGVPKAPEGIIAYHGSPHTFDKFSMDKIGTGEGAQAYGHGLYFAENEGVAKSYRDALAKPSWQIPPEKIAPELADLGFDPKALELARDTLRNLNGDGYQAVSALDGVASNTGSKVAKEAASAIRSFSRNAERESGSMYQVRLNVQPHELLDWDKPLSEQSKAVRDALHSQPEVQQRISDASKILGPKADDMKGESAYAALTGWRRGAQLSPPSEVSAAVSQRLKQAGVKGIRYKDAGSRDGSGGTSNYVIFDDKLIDILKRYGIPMTAGAGGAMMVAGQNMPPEVANQLGPQS